MTTRFAKLDYYTIKPQLLYSAVSLVFLIVIFAVFLKSTLIMLFFNMAWYLALLSTTIFASQEKNNLERLYGTFPLNIKNIVRGRYLFVVQQFVIASLAVAVLYAGVCLFQNKPIPFAELPLTVAASLLVLSVIIGIQFPIYFGLGYAKAKIVVLVPVFIFVLLPVLFSNIELPSWLTDLFNYESLPLIPVYLLACIAVLWFSCRISVALYRRRK